MPQRDSYDAIIVGSGPNGLAAAITLARAGRSVLVLEAEETIGGGTRSAELTLPGFIHDICSAVHPLGVASPFFQSLPLEEYGLEWVYPSVQLAHPLDDGSAVLLERSVEATAEGLGDDRDTYRKLMAPLVRDWDKIGPTLLSPKPLPRYPITLARFGLYGIRSAQGLAKSAFTGTRARALFAGMAAHSILPLDQPLTAGVGLLFAALGHKVGWPVARGGSQQIADALSCYLRSLGGEIVTGMRVESVDQLPPAQAVLFDVTPRQLLRITGERLPAGYRRQLTHYRYGPGVFKLDWALDGPIPWTAAECARAASVHLGGTLEEIAASERAVGRGEHPERPFVLLAQQTVCDPTRAPAGKHTAWAYCHVPNGSTWDMTDRIEGQIERFAPGFRQRILARSIMGPAAMEQHDANYIGGDINGGVQDIWQFYTRPVIRLNPYSTPAKGLFICSSSTPPGGGVHGLCGYFAAQTALRHTTTSR
ncbi:MAG TPA: NAD(P)/FAD-dependent oxidoreductase [Herpetosiphonaceae bacterium]|nr:NAD(P)/FAD-dependent oxidoreductase [Herpetosiphonaceae bacterium]